LIRRLALSLAFLCALAIPATALAVTPKTPKETGPPEATVKIRVGHLHGGKAQIYSKVPVVGSIAPFAPGQKVEVSFFLDGKPLLSRKVAVQKGKGDTGSFRASVLLREGGKYAVSAQHEANAVLGGDSTVRKGWAVSYPALHQGQCGDVVVGFKKAMRKMGYIANSGRCFGGKTARGVLAYRKVNGLSRSYRAGAGLVKSAFSGKGEYHVIHPAAGEHLEAPLSKQVLVFAKGDKPFAVYPISSGKSSTPTVTGHYTFIRQEPGYNSHGMYYSFYFYGGYAVHGYESVPDYPASHGCIRTFIADQPEIYERINYGESIFVF
jgi:hypothetical protein